jgi:23S rRNA (cytosine1962-C5)-methyltransferase
MARLYPRICLLPHKDRRILAGHPWVYANEIRLDDAAKAIPPGSLVTLETASGRALGTASFNVHSLIAARLYDKSPDSSLGTDFFGAKLSKALALRQRFFASTYYRLVYAEGDGLPGFIIDRFNDAFVVQANTAGASMLLAALIPALKALAAPKIVLLRNDSPIRSLEGLDSHVRYAEGGAGTPVEVVEGGLVFPIDIERGQKTGWFYDLAQARTLVAGLAHGCRVLDLYCHTGAFGLRAAAAGAKSVLGIDRAEPALALARLAAERNRLGGRCAFRAGDGFTELAKFAAGPERFDLVIADPPSFVKSRKELGQGRRGYRKLAKLAATVTAPGGLLFIACCSHHVPPDLFAEEVAKGLAASGRQGRILASGGAGPDHPVHPFLPESAYLKYQLLQLD